jgi:phage head maturation protease
VQNVRKVEVTVAKVDKKLGLVVGYAIVCKVKNADGAFEDYYDTGSVDPATGEVYSDHITEEAMLEGVTEFMKSSARVATEMHEREVDENGDQVLDDEGRAIPVQKGTIVHSFPLTEDIANSLGIAVEKTGWIVAMQPDPEVLKKFESGELRQFSIGGRVARNLEASK